MVSHMKEHLKIYSFHKFEYLWKKSHQVKYFKNQENPTGMSISDGTPSSFPRPHSIGFIQSLLFSRI